jgi:hypothetical protein
VVKTAASQGSLIQIEEDADPSEPRSRRSCLDRLLTKVSAADPSNEHQSWWQDVEFSVLSQLRIPNAGSVTNPFENGDRGNNDTVGTSRSAPASSSLKPSHSIKRKPPPPMPDSKPQHLTGKVNGSQLGAGYPPSQALLKPAFPRKLSSTSSLLDEDNDESMRLRSRPQTNREATTEWQVISPNGSA